MNQRCQHAEVTAESWASMCDECIECIACLAFPIFYAFKY
jgi:hypothetical protein